MKTGCRLVNPPIVYTKIGTRSAQERITPEHSKYFDAWRGISALVVVIAHVFQTFASDFSPEIRLFSSALSGAAVMAFFALSGFFIHKSISRCYSGSLDWRSFANARAERILIPFIACLILTILLWQLAPIFFASHTHRFITATGDRFEYSLTGLWQTAFFLNGFLGPTLPSNGPLWSLSFEIWYYTLACLFCMALTGQRAGWIAIPLLLVLTLLNTWFVALGLVWLGGFLASILHAQKKLPALPKIPTWPGLVALLAATMLADSAIAGKIAVVFRLAFGAWMVGHIIYILKRESVPKMPALTWLGSFSYSLYVLHFPIVLFTYGVSENGSAALAAFICAFGFAAIAGRRLERLPLPSSLKFRPRQTSY